MWTGQVEKMQLSSRSLHCPFLTRASMLYQRTHDPSQGTPSRRTRRLHASRRPAKKIAKKRSKKERMKRKKRRKSWGRSSVHYSERCRRFHPVGGQQEHIREAYHSARVSFGHKAPKLKLPSFYFAFKVTSVTKL